MGNKLSASGFTLLEILIAIAIGSLVILSVVTLNVVATSTFIYYREKSSSNEEATYLLSSIAKQVQMAGGGPVSIDAAIWVEDGNNGNLDCPARRPFAACDGSDRLTLIKYNSFSFVDLSVDASQLGSCMVTSTISPISLQIYKDAGNICCLNAGFANQQALLVLNGSYAQKYISAVDLVNCQVTIADGPAASHNSFPAPPDWNGASLNIVSLTTYYLDPATNLLMQYSDPLNRMVLDATTAKALSDQVYDFQVSLGYDVKPVDGMVTDLGTDQDEWLYNAQGLPESLFAGFLSGTARSTLSMVQLGVTIGFKNPAVAAGSPPVRLFNGPPVPVPAGMTLIRAVNKVMPRNTQVFK